MYKYLYLIISLFSLNGFAQETYHAPIINLTQWNDPVEKVGFDFGLLPYNSNALAKGYYIWLDDQWYIINNFSTLFKIANNGLALEKLPGAQNLEIQDQLEVVYTFPFEALDKYKITAEQYAQLSEIIITSPATAIIESKPEISETISTNNDTLKKIGLDEIEIVEIIKKDTIPFHPKDTIRENSTIISQNDSLETIINPAEIKPENPYEIAVNKGFDGTVTEWFEAETKKNGKTPYEQALENGYEGSETEYMR